MKICLIGIFSESADDAKGGVANVILYLAQALSDRGHEVHIVSTGTKNKSLEWPGFTAHYIKAPHLVPRLFSNLTLVRYAIQRRIKEISPDICHFHGTATYMLHYPGPHVLTLHGVQELDVRSSGGSRIKSYLQAKIESYCRKKAKNIILISPYLSDVIGQDINGQTWTIENPVASEFFSIRRTSKKEIFYAGMVSRRKNVLGLLKVFCQISKKDNDVLLKIAGPAREGDYLKLCKDYITSQSLDSKVHFLGSLTPRQIAQELSGAACTVLFSLQETAPLIISESMAAGVPVVATDVGGTKYLIEENVTGYLVASEDLNPAVQYISNIVNDRKLSLEMGVRSKESALKRFHIDAVVEKTLAVYEHALSMETAENAES